MNVLDESVEQTALLSHVAKFHVEGGAMASCCTQPENLTRENTVPQRSDLTVRICRQCNRRHFHLKAEPMGPAMVPGAGEMLSRRFKELEAFVTQYGEPQRPRIEKALAWLDTQPVAGVDRSEYIAQVLSG